MITKIRRLAPPVALAALLTIAGAGPARAAAQSTPSRLTRPEAWLGPVAPDPTERDRPAWFVTAASQEAKGGWWSRRTKAQKVWFVVGIVAGAALIVVVASDGYESGSGDDDGGAGGGGDGGGY